MSDLVYHLCNENYTIAFSIYFVPRGDKTTTICTRKSLKIKEKITLVPVKWSDEDSKLLRECFSSVVYDSGNNNTGRLPSKFLKHYTISMGSSNNTCNNTFFQTIVFFLILSPLSITRTESSLRDTFTPHK